MVPRYDEKRKEHIPHTLSFDGDAYGASNSTGTATLTGSSTFAFFLGADVGTHTLADLQAGLVSGITANTPVAIWIGLTNRADGATASADISSVTVVPEPATMGLLILGGLAALARRRQRA